MEKRQTVSVSTMSGSFPQAQGHPNVNLLGFHFPIYKVDMSPRPNSQLCRGDSQNQKQVEQPKSLGWGAGKGKGHYKTFCDKTVET